MLLGSGIHWPSADTPFMTYDIKQKKDIFRVTLFKQETFRARQKNEQDYKTSRNPEKGTCSKGF